MKKLKSIILFILSIVILITSCSSHSKNDETTETIKEDVEIVEENEEIIIDKDAIIVENAGLIANKQVCNVNDIKEKEELAFTTGFIEHEYGISYIDDGYNMKQSCIMKIDGIEYCFDDAGNLVKGQSIMMHYPAPDRGEEFYSAPRLIDENGIYINEMGVHEVNGKNYYVNHEGILKSLKESLFILYDGIFYECVYDKSSIEDYKLVQVEEDKIIEAIDFKIHLEGSVNINSKYYNEEDWNEIKDENIIEKLISELDYKNADYKIQVSKAITTEIDKNKFGFQNVKFNDYVRKNIHDAYYSYFYVSKKNSKVYLKENKKLALNEIIQIDDKKYLFDIDNLLVINNVHSLGNKTYLTDKNGVIIEKEGIYSFKNVVNNIFSIDLHSNYEEKYYVNKNGLVEKNKFIEYEDNVYFAGNDGILYKNKFYGSLYFNNECKLDKSMDENYEIDFVKENKNIYYKALNSKKFLDEPIHIDPQGFWDIMKSVRPPVEPEKTAETVVSNYKLKVNNEYINNDDFEKYKISEMIVEDKLGNVVKNRFVDLIYDNKYYIGENGNIVHDAIIDLNGEKYLFDSNGKQVKNVWLYDYDFYENENKREEYNPYISKYKIKRNVIKDYLGYYVNNYIITDNIKIEQSARQYYSYISEDIRDTYQCYLYENGKYEYSNEISSSYYAENQDINGIDSNYEPKEIEEGVYKFVHDKKGINENRTPINEDTLTEQLCRLSIIDKKHKEKNDETVKFGSWYIRDKTGQEKDKIRWQILKKDKNKALLISEKVIDCMPFHNSDEIVTWSNCDLRKWLNEDFYNEAFSEEEKKYIYNVKQIDLNYDNSIENNSEVIDKIFLPPDDIDKYFVWANEEPRYGFTSALSQKFYKVEFSRYAKEKQNKLNNDNNNFFHSSYWTINSKVVDGKSYATIVDRLSENSYSETLVNNNLIGVRPIIWVKYNNKNDDEYTNDYNEIEDRYYQQLLNDDEFILNEEYNSDFVKNDLANQITFCKSISDYNGENIEEVEHIVFGTAKNEVKMELFEPIKWIILEKDEENKRALLASKYIIDARGYNDKKGDVTWETSDIRKWLNSEFYNQTFTKEEKLCIEETIVITNDAIFDKEEEFIVNHIVEGGNDTKDRIFLLSIDEVDKYFTSKNENLALGIASKNFQSEYSYNSYDSPEWNDVYNLERGCYPYMTRSPGNQQNCMQVVGMGPTYWDLYTSESTYTDYVNNPFSYFSGYYYGIRPAMWVSYK